MTTVASPGRQSTDRLCNGYASRALRRRLQTLAGEIEIGGAPFDPGFVPTTGTTLLVQWRGHAHTVLVRKDGFQYEGQRCRSLTGIAERIDNETQVLSIPVRLRRCGREITMLIDGADPSAAAKPDMRLIKLLIVARRFNAALIGSDGVPFAVLAEQEGVSLSYFTRLVRLSYLAPDITQAILDGRQPRGLTADKLPA
jgi:hypothetical protein